jgi:hypothetical protein
MAATKLEKYAEDLVDRVADGEVGINDAIEDLNKRLEVFDRVKVHRDRLLAARRALLGVGSRTTSAGGSRTTSDEVAQWLEANGPASYQEMAGALGTTDAVIRGHMSRNKDRFEKNGDGKWHVIDHEAEEGNDESEEEDE